ncbi:hypothetical protein [Pilimelia anulata]|uniref:hypothetical protein n=1 Tax=Pilimelia anulata TaxID=53371 RepID=UPI001667CA83|nr:hypothetical protein [Pilimelia anulata]
MRHRPVRRLWTPWRIRCRCGCPWYPCPDAVAVVPPVRQSLGLDLPDEPGDPR